MISIRGSPDPVQEDAENEPVGPVTVSDNVSNTFFARKLVFVTDFVTRTAIELPMVAQREKARVMQSGVSRDGFARENSKRARSLIPSRSRFIGTASRLCVERDTIRATLV